MSLRALCNTLCKGQLPIDKAKKKTVKYLSCVPLRRESAWPAENTIGTAALQVAFFHQGHHLMPFDFWGILHGSEL
jgi:hypothetical protein